MKMIEGAMAIASSNSLRSYRVTRRNLTHLLLALSTHAAHDLGRADADERHSQLAAHCTGEERLTTTRRTVKQDSAGRVDSDVRVDFGVGKGVLDEFANILENAIDSGQIRVRMKECTVMTH